MSKIPPPPPGSDRRQHERFDLLAQIELDHAGDVRVLEVGDISAGGLSVRFSSEENLKLHIGTSVNVFLDVSELGAAPENSLQTQADIVHIMPAEPTVPGKLGLMWTSRDPEVATKLAGILEFLRNRSDEA